jgi:hypothetical protein
MATSFESRTGRLSSSAAEVYSFLTDIRNMEQFIPAGSITSWKVERESCSFNVTPLGTVNIKLTEKEPDRKVVFSGNALQINDFSLAININGIDNNPAEVRILLSADMNPVLLMVASDPVKRFLETLISEMEKFDRWKDVR